MYLFLAKSTHYIGSNHQFKQFFLALFLLFVWVERKLQHSRNMNVVTGTVCKKLTE